ncbi:MAG TPA: VWA domain-containing protein [Vicinamibacterales bacterium]|nr:VWA domain-containing protein [Vicinamibacterales bacterium]
MSRIVVLLTAVVALVAAQPRFRADLDVVNVTVTVTDKGGRFVSGLQKDDFIVLEDGRPRDVVFFAGESAPVSLGILLDASGSMTGTKLSLARQAIARLVTNDVDATTEWLLARFTATVVVAQDWTADRAAIVQPLRETRATGDTSLYDAVALTIPIVGDGHNLKKSLLVVSDGVESKSLLSLRDVQTAIGESDVRVYGLGIDALDAKRGERLNIETLRRLSDDTGAHTWTVSNAAEIPAATLRLADELRHQYLLGFATTAVKNGQRHSIKVEVRGRGHAVAVRRGYVAG